MDYRSNEDYYPWRQNNGAAYNNIIDVLFVEDSSPVTEPATYAEALVQCNIDDQAQDVALINSYITTARMQCEAYTGIGFIYRTIQAVIRNQLGDIYLPYGPIGTVQSAVNQDGDAIEVKIDGIQWKTVRTVFLDATLTYTAGYAELPTVFKTALLQQVAYLYEHRGDEQAGQFSPVVKSLLQPHRRA